MFDCLKGVRFLKVSLIIGDFCRFFFRGDNDWDFDLTGDKIGGKIMRFVWVDSEFCNKLNTSRLL